MMTIEHLCENCQSRGMAVFYEVEDVPILSNVLLSSPAAALAQPHPLTPARALPLFGRHEDENDGTLSVSSLSSA